MPRRLLSLIAANARSVARLETLNGVEHYVVPMVLLTPGVLNGSNGPLYYPPAENARPEVVDAWNGMPIVLGHPTDGTGNHVSARDPAVIDKYGIGTVYNSGLKRNGASRAEAWLTVSALERKAPQVLDAVRNGRPVELSTGLYTRNTPVSNGRCPKTGRNYTAVASNYRPDHLAVLVGATGACSLKDGCGLGVNASSLPVETDARKTKRKKAKRYTLLTENCGGKGGKPGPCPTGVGEHPHAADAETALKATKHALKLTRELDGNKKPSGSWSPHSTAAAQSALKHASGAVTGSAAGGVNVDRAVYHREAAERHDRAAVDHEVRGKGMGATAPKHQIAAAAHRAAAELHRSIGTKIKGPTGNCGGPGSGKPGPCPTGANETYHALATAATVKAASAFSAAGKATTAFAPLKASHAAYAASTRALRAKGWGTGGTSGHHLAATKAHLKAAETLRNAGHTEAASKHREAASAHSTLASHLANSGLPYSGKVTNMSRKPKTPVVNSSEGGSSVSVKKLNRAKVIAALTANCDCWKGGEKTLNGMSDDQLRAVREATVVQNSVTKRLKELDPDAEPTTESVLAFVGNATAEVEPDEDDAGKTVAKKAKKGAKPVGNTAAEKANPFDGLTDAEVFDLLPATVKGVVANAKRREDKDRAGMIGRLVGNLGVTGEAAKKVAATFNKLGTGELEEAVAALPAKKLTGNGFNPFRRATTEVDETDDAGDALDALLGNGGPVNRMARYGPTGNAKAGDDEGDGEDDYALTIPEMDLTDNAEFDPKRANRRRDAGAD